MNEEYKHKKKKDKLLFHQSLLISSSLTAITIS